MYIFVSVTSLTLESITLSFLGPCNQKMVSEMTFLHLFTCQAFNTPSNLFTFHNLACFARKTEMQIVKMSLLLPASLQNKQTIATCLSIPFYLTFFLLKMSFPHILPSDSPPVIQQKTSTLQLPPISPSHPPALCVRKVSQHASMV